CVALVISVALGEGIHSLSQSEDLPDSSDYAHYWKIRHAAHKPELSEPELVKPELVKPEPVQSAKDD
ncbi:MAG TPA: hypothetical protein V6C65_21710, partial [Allocoleopsis sp.]